METKPEEMCNWMGESTIPGFPLESQTNVSPNYNTAIITAFLRPKNKRGMRQFQLVD